MTERQSSNPLKGLQGGDDVLGGGLGGNRGPDAPPEDAVELWARRTGRAFAVVATIGLIGWCLYKASGQP